MLFKALSRIPVLGVVLVIINSYVWGGNFNADERFAPFWRWLRVLGPAVGIAFALTVWMLWPAFDYLVAGIAPCLEELSPVALKPGEIATTVLPNVLGFGIGVYALIFVLSNKLLNIFHTAMTAKDGSTALAINADMAFPLVVMLSAIACGLLQQRSPESFEWLLISWFLLWYALVLTLGLISSLFRLGEVAIVDKLDGDGHDVS